MTVDPVTMVCWAVDLGPALPASGFAVGESPGVVPAAVVCGVVDAADARDCQCSQSTRCCKLDRAVVGNL